MACVHCPPGAGPGHDPEPLHMWPALLEHAPPFTGYSSCHQQAVTSRSTAVCWPQATGPTDYGQDQDTEKDRDPETRHFQVLYPFQGHA